LEVLRIDLSRLISPRRPLDHDVGEWLVGLINEINKVLKARQFGLLNSVLESVDPSELDAEATLAFLRTTYSVRRTLSAWTGLRDRAKSAFELRELDHRALLRGLT
jgi:hypothetical protein